MSANGHLQRGLEELEIGATLVSRGRTITETDVVSFAALTGDWHPQHSDAEWASSSRFGERVAHGMLLISYGIGLLPLDPERVVALRGLDGLVFKRPVSIGDTIHAEARVDGVRPVDEAVAIADLALRIKNQRGATVARATVHAVWRRDPAPGEPNGPAPRAEPRGAEPERQEVFL